MKGSLKKTVKTIFIFLIFLGTTFGCDDEYSKTDGFHDIVKVDCQNMYDCNQDMFLEKYSTVSDCIEDRSQAMGKAKFDKECPDFKSDAFLEYMSCREKNGCDYFEACLSELKNACYSKSLEANDEI